MVMEWVITQMRSLGIQQKPLTPIMTGLEYADAFPTDATETVDTDEDGVGNSDWAPNDASESADSDGDGVGDNADAFPNDASGQLTQTLMGLEIMQMFLIMTQLKPLTQIWMEWAIMPMLLMTMPPKPQIQTAME